MVIRVIICITFKPLYETNELTTTEDNPHNLNNPDYTHVHTYIHTYIYTYHF